MKMTKKEIFLDHFGTDIVLQVDYQENITIFTYSYVLIVFFILNYSRRKSRKRNTAIYRLKRL